MKKKAAALFAAVLIFSALFTVLLTGCGTESSASAGKEGPSLYMQGKQTISLLSEMLKSDEYLDMMTAQKSVKDVLKVDAGGNYDEPTACFEVILTEEKLSELTADTKFNELPSSLRQYFTDRLASIVASRINAQNGAASAAAASLCTAGRLFVNTAVRKPAMYLYTFSDTAPVLVSFVPGEDGAVSSGAVLLFAPEFRSVASAEDVQKAFDKVLPGCTVEGIPMS